MKRSVSALAVALCAASTNAQAQSWGVRVSQDPFTDKPTYLASLNTRRHSMMVRCKDERLEVYLVIVGYLGDAADVRYRFDQGEVRSNTWDTSTDGTGVFAPGPGEFARSLMSASVLHFEVSGEYGSPETLRIPLAGSSAAIGRVLDGCGVPRQEIYQPDGPIWRRAVEAIDLAQRPLIPAVAEFLKELGHYDGPIDTTRRISLYQGMSDFYSGYWRSCEAGQTLTQSCTSWTASRRYDADADYPKEPLELLAEVMQARMDQERGGSDALAPSQSPKPALVTNVDWSRAPTPQFPERAQARGLTAGSATLTCVVSPNGAPTNCEIVSEEPAGAGFGQAALRSVLSARFHSATVNGVAPGGRARFTIRFRP